MGNKYFGLFAFCIEIRALNKVDNLVAMGIDVGMGGWLTNTQEKAIQIDSIQSSHTVKTPCDLSLSQLEAVSDTMPNTY